jgi:hypothetical protein
LCIVVLNLPEFQLSEITGGAGARQGEKGWKNPQNMAAIGGGVGVKTERTCDKIFARSGICHQNSGH